MKPQSVEAPHRILAVASLAAAITIAACGPAVTGPDEPVARMTTAPVVTTSASSAPQRPTSAVALPASSGPASSSSAPPAAASADPKSFSCGDGKCASGKETCCDVSGITRESHCIAAPAAPEGVREPSKVFEIECRRQNTLPRYTLVLRCDESQDCADGEACCEGGDGELPFYDVRCRKIARSQGGGPCPGDELCIAGGPPCRTPGAECIAEKCVKKPANPKRVCESAADCLAGQHCIHPSSADPSCTAHVPMFEPCKTDAECQTFCTQKRGICRIPKILGATKDPDAPRYCECP